jgi:hypothetical protein
MGRFGVYHQQSSGGAGHWSQHPLWFASKQTPDANCCGVVPLFLIGIFILESPPFLFDYIYWIKVRPEDRTTSCANVIL